MKKFALFLLFLTTIFQGEAQTFIRSELPTPLINPWEITYGPDNYLWITEYGGKVCRVDPNNGNKTTLFSAPDYYDGSPLEQLQNCFQPNIGTGTLGLTLDPDFLDSLHSYIYFVYSYNSGDSILPSTKFKIKRLKWDANTSTVTNDTDLVSLISTGYDHLGGRLLAIKQNNISHLFLSIGDHGISETNSPTCYIPQTDNPNNLAQDPTTQNGKIHRFNIDGSIPTDNPIYGNSFYTRGHRNPQGLMYNPNLDLIYDVEHGDRSDDEINILHAGMNYGWKDVRGYHNDNNYPGEANYIANYIPNPLIANDSLVEAFYAWCATPQDTSQMFINWCTVAPSDGIYYGSPGIADWTNSLLVVTLKNGVVTDNEVFQFKLLANGDLAPSSPGNPNPKTFFAGDELLNGRLRDIAISPNGRRLFLINNGGAPTDKIIIYDLDTTSIGIPEVNSEQSLSVYPNPAKSEIRISSNIKIERISLLNIEGQTLLISNQPTLNVERIPSGLYFILADTDRGILKCKFIKE